MEKIGNRSASTSLWRALEEDRPAEVLEAGIQNDAPVVMLTARGLAELEVGNHAAARETLLAVLEREPQNPVATLHLVLALFHCGEDREAGRVLKAAVLHPHLGYLRRFVETFWPLRFGTSLRHEMATSNSALTVSDPHNDEFTKLQSQKGGAAADDGPAISAASVDPRARKVADSYMRMGIKAYTAGNFAQSREFLRRANLLAPENEKIATHYAYISLFAGEAQAAWDVLHPVMERALAAYDAKRDISSLPGYDTIVCFAWTLHELDRQRDAIGMLALVYEEGPEDYGANFVLAVSWLMLGEKDNFTEAFDRSMTKFYIDTWEQLLRPFVLTVANWLEKGGRESHDQSLP